MLRPYVRGPTAATLPMPALRDPDWMIAHLRPTQTHASKTLPSSRQLYNDRELEIRGLPRARTGRGGGGGGGGGRRQLPRDFINDRDRHSPEIPLPLSLSLSLSLSSLRLSESLRKCRSHFLPSCVRRDISRLIISQVIAGL
jgi:hypothetical protein